MSNSSIEHEADSAKHYLSRGCTVGTLTMSPGCHDGEKCETPPAQQTAQMSGMTKFGSGKLGTVK
jgi:hypothetical protein